MQGMNKCLTGFRPRRLAVVCQFYQLCQCVSSVYLQFWQAKEKGHYKNQIQILRMLVSHWTVEQRESFHTALEHHFLSLPHTINYDKILPGQSLSERHLAA